MIKIGNSDITSIKVGTSGCSAYLGDVKLYPTESKNYFSTEMIGDGGIKFTIPSGVSTSSLAYVEYTLADQYYQNPQWAYWDKITNVDGQEVSRSVWGSSGTKYLWRGSGTRTCEGNATNVNYIARFSGQFGNYKVEGNAMSLLFGDDHVNSEFDSGTTYHMAGLFSGDTYLVDASGMTLPATKLYDNDYNNMFKGCSNMASIPQLAQASFSTTQNGGGCYKRMFADCTSLTAIPSGITIGSSSSVAPKQLCEGMFSGCTSLTTVPSGLLPATTLQGEQNYRYMFKDCSRLMTAPQLPATTLANNCYTAMFQFCSSLTTSAQLPATTLADGCYANMFYGCSNLTTVYELPALNLADNCYNSMFYGCRFVTEAPILSAETLVASCYKNMFWGCSNLSSIKCLATDISATDCTSYWLNGVAQSGTFTKAASMTAWTSGGSGIPSGWTIQNSGTTPNFLAVKSLANNNNISFGNQGYTASDFVAKTIKYSVNNTIWSSTTSTSGVTSIIATLNSGDTIYFMGSESNYSATNKKYHFIHTSANAEVKGNAMSMLYGENFDGQTIISSSGALRSLFCSTTSSTNYITSIDELELPATTLSEACYQSMFDGCSGLTSLPSGLLPSTSLTADCYRAMFANCVNLTTVPSDLLQATTLADRCYQYMFQKTSLTVAPTLPAPTLTVGCYGSMFGSASTLSAITCLATDISASACTNNWVANVAPSGTFTKPEGMTAWTSGNSGIPNGWTVEDKIDYTKKYLTVKSLADNNVVTFAHGGGFTAKTISCSTDNGVTWTSVTSENGVSKTLATLQTGDKLLLKGTNGNYTNHRISSSADAELEGNIMSLYYSDNFVNGNYQYSGVYSGMCRDWTTLKSCENLKMPATTLDMYCYQSMFEGCTALTTPLEILPASELPNNCYLAMFKNCKSMTAAPILPAATLAWGCYQSMFNGCKSLTSITCLATNNSAFYCTSNWLLSASSTGTFTKAASMSSWTRGTSGIPNGWTVVDYSG